MTLTLAPRQSKLNPGEHLNELNIQLGRAIELAKPKPEGQRKAARKAIRAQLEIVAQAEQTAKELTNKIAELEAELSRAVEDHQRSAKPIQDKLAATTDVEKRLSLREQLGQINHDLQETADKLNSRIDACEAERHSLPPITCQRPPLERGLVENGDLPLLRLLELAQTTHGWAQQRLKHGKKLLEETEGATRPNRNSAGWGQVKAIEQPELSPERAETLERRKLEVEYSTKAVADAEAEIARIKQEIVNS